MVSDDRGDIEASLTDPTGLFSFDTRFLSKWVLTVNGERLNPLSVDDLQYFETRFFLVPGTGTVYVDSKLSVIRQRAVGNGFHEELTILNHDEKPVDLTVRIDAGCDFADLFEVKDALEKKGKYVNRVEQGRLRLAYERDTFVRSTLISATRPREVDEDGLTFKVKIEPHGSGRPISTSSRRCWATASGTSSRSSRTAAAGRTWNGTWSGGSRTRRGSSATGIRSRRRTGGASSTSPPCASPRPSPAGEACPPPACPGS